MDDRSLISVIGFVIILFGALAVVLGALGPSIAEVALGIIAIIAGLWLSGK